MTVRLFLHSRHRLAVQPSAGDNPARLRALLYPVPCLVWHPEERLWTVPLAGTLVRPLVRRLVAAGYVEPPRPVAAP